MLQQGQSKVTCYIIPSYDILRIGKSTETQKSMVAVVLDLIETEIETVTWVLGYFFPQIEVYLLIYLSQ